MPGVVEKSPHTLSSRYSDGDCLEDTQQWPKFTLPGQDWERTQLLDCSKLFPSHQSGCSAICLGAEAPDTLDSV